MSRSATMGTAARWSPAPFVLRLALAYAVVALLAMVVERPLDAAAVPCVKVGLAAFHPEIRVRTVSSEHGRLTVDFAVARFGAADGAHLVTGSVATNGKLALVAPLLTLSVLLAWRFESARERAVGLALAALLVAALAAYDLSATLALGIASGLGDSPSSVARFASFFMDAGGRQFFALASAGAAITLAAARRRPPSR